MSLKPADLFGLVLEDHLQLLKRIESLRPVGVLVNWAVIAQHRIVLLFGDHGLSCMALHLSLHLDDTLLRGLLLTSKVELFDVHGIHLELCPGALACSDLHLSYN